MADTALELALVDLDLRSDDDAALFGRGYEAADVAGNRLLLGERHGSRTADEIVTRTRADATHENRAGVVLVGGEPVATWLMGLPVHDNLTTADVSVAVAPEHRRRGVGSAVLAHAEELTRSAGRHVLQTWAHLPAAPDAPDPATAFATRHGFVSTLPSLRSDLDLDVPDGDVSAALDAALAPLDAEVAGTDLADCRLVTWWDGAPEEHLADKAHLMARMSTDAPTGGMTAEPEHWDAGRVRAQEAVPRAQGRSVVETAALHVPSGRLVAWTQIGVPAADPEHVFQWNTLVLREHRGRRLGMWVKAANLRALVARFPQVRRVTTYNAAVNAPMLRVNLAMGFRPVCRETCFEKRLV